jgi:carbamoyltransferase
MKILGIHDGHNATAALLVDGKIIANISEERLTYRKNEMGFPKKAINECLKIGGLTGTDLDLIAFSNLSLNLNYLKVKREYAFTVRDWLNEQEYYWKPLIFEKKFNADYWERLFKEARFREKQAYDLEKVPLIKNSDENNYYLKKIRLETLKKLYNIDENKIFTYDHHTCHQHYAYFASPFRKKPAIIFTCDGGGDGANGTICLVENDRIKELARNNCSDLARIYRYITLFLGMKIGEHEYKVMGLSPYASEYEIGKCDAIFNNIFHVPDLLIEYKNKTSDLFFYFKDKIADCRFDGIAGAVQKMVEEVGEKWFSNVAKKLKIKRVVFSGGLSMNVKLNHRIAKLGSIKEFYCPGSGGDESSALGACYVAHRGNCKSQVDNIRNNYLRMSFTKKDILDVVAKVQNCEIRWHVNNSEVSELLAKNYVIGRFSGKMEFGARALGNRSIITNPSNPNAVEKINKQIKFRDFWMPFAPSILDTYAEKYLVNPKYLLSDHMTLSFDVTQEGKNALIAAIHPADHTARAHIVNKSLNPDYYDLIEAFEKKTGIGAVLNTSFNLHGYPIVCTPKQAVHVFENSDLDAILLDDILVLRKR